jgi:L-amino acid N-acyltransferase YncA
MEPMKATVADVERLEVFFREAWEETGPGGLGFTGTTEETINEIASKQFLLKRLANADVQMYIVEEAGRVMGFASTRRINEYSIELSGIIVLESATGKGLGTNLAQKALSAAREAGYRKAVVKTETFNARAIRFYKKIGFAEVGTAKENVEGTPVEVTILEKQLQ